jgi:hypothetical protein
VLDFARNTVLKNRTYLYEKKLKLTHNKILFYLKRHLCTINKGICRVYYNRIYTLIKLILGSWLPSLIGFSLNMVIIVSIYKASFNLNKLTNNSKKTDTASVNSSRFELNNLNEKSSKNITINERKKCFADRTVMDLKHLNEAIKTPSKSIDFSTLTSRLNEKRSSNPYKEKQITIMLLTVSISFVVLTMPYSLFELMRKILDHETFHSFIPKNKVRDFQRATLLLIDLNHSTNFFFYVLTAERFRTQLKSILMFWKK